MTLPSLMTASAQPGESGLFHLAKRSSILLLNDADFPRGPDTHPTLTARVRTTIAPVIVPSFAGRIADIRGGLRQLTPELSDAGGSARPNCRLMWPARAGSSDFRHLATLLATPS